MITNFLLSFLGGTLSFVFGFIPQVTSMPEWYDNISSTFSVISGLNAIPLLGTVIEITLLVLTILAGWQSIVWANWLYNKIRGSG